MAELLSLDKDMAASFLNSVLNQLNWAFSEFIGMIQEVSQHGTCFRPRPVCGPQGAWGPGGLGTDWWKPVSAPQIQQAAERPERNFVDTRQLKVSQLTSEL